MKGTTHLRPISQLAYFVCCRINIQPEISATIIENVKLSMFDLSLFHDCTINIFPLLLNYWKIFCLRRHKYIPRAEISQFKVSFSAYFLGLTASVNFTSFKFVYTFYSATTRRRTPWCSGKEEN